jgi:hypothetical protein
MWIAALGFFLSVVLIFLDSHPISNNYDFIGLFSLYVFLPAPIFVLGLIFLQKWIRPQLLLISVLVLELGVIFAGGIIALEFNIYNGDSLMYIVAYFIVYYPVLYSAIVAGGLGILYLSTILMIDAMRNSAPDSKHIINRLYSAALLVAGLSLVGIWIAINYSFGLHLFYWGIILGLAPIIDAWKTGKDAIIQADAISPDQGTSEICPKTLPILWTSSRLKNVLMEFLCFLLAFLWGYLWNFDFFRIVDMNGEENVSMFYLLNARTSIQEAEITLLVFLICGVLIQPVSKRIHAKLALSPHLEAILGGATVLGTMILWRILALGRLIFPFRINTLLYPWIFLLAVGWLVHFWGRRDRRSPGLIGIQISSGALAIWSALILSPETDLAAEILESLIWTAIGITAVIYLLNFKLLKRNPAQHSDQSASINRYNMNIISFRAKRIMTGIAMMVLVLVPSISIGVIVTDSDGYQLLANVDNHAIFYLADPTSRISEDFKPRFGFSDYNNPNSTINLAAAKNEYEAVQIIMRPVNQKSFTIYNIQFSGFTHTQSAATIGAGNFSAYIVEYIPELANIVADRLVPFYPIGVSKFVNLPFWLNFYIPSDAAPGDYTGIVTFTVDNKTDPNEWYTTMPVTFEIHMHVFDFRLPTTPSLKSNFGFWTGKFDQVIELYAPHRMMHWSFAHYPTCSLNLDGTVASINFTSLIDEVTRIHAYGTRTIGIHAGGYNQIIPTPGVTLNSGFYTQANFTNAPEYDLAMTTYYAQLTAFLRNQTDLDEFGRNRSWFDEFYINGYDEIQARPQDVIDRTMAEYDWLKNTINCSLPLMQTVMGELDGKYYILDNVDIICWHTQGKELPFIEDAKQQGKQIWIYTTRGPRFASPSIATSGMATQVRALGWQCFVYNYSNYLIWDIATPLNARGGYGYQGWNGGTLLYAAPTEMGYYQSTRLELIREGFEDYEYFHLLQTGYHQWQQSHPGQSNATFEGLLTRINHLFTFYQPEMDYREFQSLRREIGFALEMVSPIQ